MAKKNKSDRIEELEDVARQMVGDSGTPDVFFVALNGNIRLITVDFEVAYSLWRSYAYNRQTCNIESCLEDRQYGVICSNEPIDDGSAQVVINDNSVSFLKNLKR